MNFADYAFCLFWKEFSGKPRSKSKFGVKDLPIKATMSIKRFEGAEKNNTKLDWELQFHEYRLMNKDRCRAFNRSTTDAGLFF